MIALSISSSVKVCVCKSVGERKRARERQRKTAWVAGGVRVLVRVPANVCFRFPFVRLGHFKTVRLTVCLFVHVSCRLSTPGVSGQGTSLQIEWR